MGNFNMLPLEIMLDILSRLPVESILDCKLVSKPWTRLVHHPLLSQLHLDRLDSAYRDSGKLSFIFRTFENGYLVFYYTEYDENCHETPFNTKRRIDFNPPFENYSFVGSSNCLICFDSWIVDSNACRYECGPAYICNPITREYILVPTCNRNYWWTGFGYSHSTKEYKVVRIHESRGDSNVGIVEIYTLGRGNGWRNAGTMDINKESVTPCAGAFANGALYWVNKEGTMIFAFHLGDEKSSQLPPPPPPTCFPLDFPHLIIGLGVLGDFLRATYYYELLDCDIWLLKKNNTNNDLSWSKEFSFRKHMSQPFEITNSGSLLCYENTRIRSYCPEASSPKMDVSFGMSICQVIRHRNTFISLKGLGEKDTKTINGIRTMIKLTQIR